MRPSFFINKTRKELKEKMSRLTEGDSRGLMDAYHSIYEGYGKKGKKKIMHDCATHVEHSEYGLGNCIKEMHTLDEEGNVSHYDVEFEHGIVENVPVSELNILVSEEHPHEANELKNAEVLDEIAVNFGGQAALAAKQKELAQQRQSSARLDALRQQRFGSGGSPSAKGGAKTRAELTGSARPTAPAARPAAPAARPTAPAARPTAPTAAPRPTAPAAAKPAPSGQTGDKAKDMATWAKANPKLAAKVTPAGTQMGTGQSTMAKQAAELRALRPVTPTQATAAAPSTSPAASGSVAPATAKLASTPKPTPVAPGYQGARKPFGEEVDAYDLVLDYLLENGHADTVDEAHYVMLEMDSQMIQNIAEAKRKSYSAKKARKGEDLGLPGPGFAEITKEAGKRYGSKKRGEKVAGAVLAGLRAKYSK